MKTCAVPWVQGHRRDIMPHLSLSQISRVNLKRKGVYVQSHVTIGIWGSRGWCPSLEEPSWGSRTMKRQENRIVWEADEDKVQGSTLRSQEDLAVNPDFTP